MSSFEELLEQDKSVSVRNRNLKILSTEMYKFYRNNLPPFSLRFFVNVI